MIDTHLGKNEENKLKKVFDFETLRRMNCNEGTTP
jgi:hypothetical protein